MANRKHSLTIAGHRTSITLEQVFWVQLKECAAADKVSINELVRRIDATQEGERNLSSAVRVYLFERVKAGRNTD